MACPLAGGPCVPAARSGVSQRKTYERGGSGYVFNELAPKSPACYWSPRPRDSLRVGTARARGLRGGGGAREGADRARLGGRPAPPPGRIGWPRLTHLRHQGPQCADWLAPPHPPTPPGPPVPDPASETRARTPPSAAGAQVGRREEVPTSTHVHRSRLTSPPEAPASTEEKESAQRSRTRSGTVIPTASLPLTCISRLQPCEQVRSGPQRPATRPAAAKRSRDTPILAPGASGIQSCDVESVCP